MVHTDKRLGSGNLGCHGNPADSCLGLTSVSGGFISPFSRFFISPCQRGMKVLNSGWKFLHKICAAESGSPHNSSSKTCLISGIRRLLGGRDQCFSVGSFKGTKEGRKFHWLHCTVFLLLPKGLNGIPGRKGEKGSEGHKGPQVSDSETLQSMVSNLYFPLPPQIVYFILSTHGVFRSWINLGQVFSTARIPCT